MALGILVMNANEIQKPQLHLNECKYFEARLCFSLFKNERWAL